MQTDPTSHPRPHQLDWPGVLSTLLGLLGRWCAVQVSADRGSAPVVTSFGVLGRSLETFDRYRGPLIIAVGAEGLLTLDPRRVVEASREYGSPGAGPAALILEIRLDDGAVIAIEAEGDLQM